jgi:large subunit ribosomal protein L18
MKLSIKKQVQRLRRKKHVRKRVSGTPDMPRLTVFRSQKNIYAQIVDDLAGRTLVAASSQEGPMQEKLSTGGGNKTAAAVVGTFLAEKAVQAGIKKVVFDRNGYPYHGRVQELADAARKAGLEF